MMDTDRKGYVHVTGDVVGGHAILCNRVNVTDRYFGLSNSWGPSGAVMYQWGLGGTCRISLADMKRLLAEDGEAWRARCEADAGSVECRIRWAAHEVSGTAHEKRPALCGSRAPGSAWEPARCPCRV